MTPVRGDCAILVVLRINDAWVEMVAPTCKCRDRRVHPDDVSGTPAPRRWSSGDISGLSLDIYQLKIRAEHLTPGFTHLTKQRQDDFRNLSLFFIKTSCVGH